MTLSAAELDSLVKLLTRIYHDILAIEEPYHLLAGDADFRPRIEHFHDAVRAYTSGDDSARAPGGRLSVEWLAYDVGCLRYICDMPLASFKPHAKTLSPSTALVRTPPPGRGKRPDRETRERLSDLYRHYAVLFAALLKPMADRDYRDRVDEMNQDAQELNAVIHHLSGMAQKKSSLENLTAAMQHVEDETLRQMLFAFIQQQRHQRRDDLTKMAAYLKNQVKEKDKAIAAIEKAHMNYVLAQFGIYEESKDMLKKMAGQGMNLVGQFVEKAMAETRREMGRG